MAEGAVALPECFVLGCGRAALHLHWRACAGLQNRAPAVPRGSLSKGITVAEEQRHDLQRAGLADAVVSKHGCATTRINGRDSSAGNTLVGTGVHKQRAAKAVCH